AADLSRLAAGKRARTAAAAPDRVLHGRRQANDERRLGDRHADWDRVGAGDWIWNAAAAVQEAASGVAGGGDGGAGGRGAFAGEGSGDTDAGPHPHHPGDWDCLPDDREDATASFTRRAAGHDWTWRDSRRAGVVARWKIESRKWKLESRNWEFKYGKDKEAGLLRPLFFSVVDCLRKTQECWHKSQCYIQEARKPPRGAWLALRQVEEQDFRVFYARELQRLLRG